jgi:hypothetical protein
MKRNVAFAALALIASPVEGHGMAPLYDPVILNVGISCQWERHCERRQLKAMSHARKFIAHKRPPIWRIHMCNRNARRGPARVDWIGFDDCMRNPNLRPTGRR